MKRFLILMLALILALVACSNGGVVEDTTTTAVPTVTAVESIEVPTATVAEQATAVVDATLPPLEDETELESVSAQDLINILNANYEERIGIDDLPSEDRGFAEGECNRLRSNLAQNELNPANILGSFEGGSYAAQILANECKQGELNRLNAGPAIEQASIVQAAFFDAEGNFDCASAEEFLRAYHFDADFLAGVGPVWEQSIHFAMGAIDGFSRTTGCEFIFDLDDGIESRSEE